LITLEGLNMRQTSEEMCPTCNVPVGKERRCPKCGRIPVYASASPAMEALGRVSASSTVAYESIFETVKEYYKKNLRILALNLLITVLLGVLGTVLGFLNPYVGMMVGILLGGLWTFFAPVAREKIREITRRI